MFMAVHAGIYSADSKHANPLSQSCQVCEIDFFRDSFDSDSKMTAYDAAVENYLVNVRP